ncbi:hypothetical protein [Planctomyces sp. SH-PL62]|uniref:hypothetical protein n=1 Tax=Planctomyces sp. SH-PL62 TaxID=1636152 RepID=UPI00078E2EB0|nr:hypothetical protein [Planctomyces sp. SH-PL62]AMV40498.1 hypothetical protein VT85_23915 [Planctomyces sp. SH-PL62]
MAKRKTTVKEVKVAEVVQLVEVEEGAFPPPGEAPTGTDPSAGRAEALRRGDKVRIVRNGVDASRPHVVVGVGAKGKFRVAPEDGPGHLSFLCQPRHLLTIVERAQPSRNAKPAKDRTGTGVRKVVHVPGRGYLAFIARGSKQTRLAPILGGKVGGPSELFNGSVTASVVYDLTLQLPEVRRAILDDPEGASPPDHLPLELG